MLLKKMRPLLIRLWRLGLLVGAIFVLQDQAQQREQAEAVAALRPERLKDFFPEATSLGEINPGNGWRAVLDKDQQSLGYICTTAPESNRIIGYSGPSNCLMAFNTRGEMMGLRLLKSHDTVEHVAEVVSDRKFFTQFHTLKPGSELKEPLHTVTGATLTSAAIAQGVLEKLGQAKGASLRFPEEITLAEIQRLEPRAQSLQPAAGTPGATAVLDAAGQRIGLALRTSPVTDTLVGYKGPSDTLMLLDASGRELKKIALRKSFDTKRYVAYVTGDAYFHRLFQDMSLEKLASLDFKEAKIEGVSGATETSWSIAEGLKRRAQSLLEDKPTGWLRKVRWRWQDSGHLLVLLSAFIMAFTRLRGIGLLRHGHHLLLVIYGGFIAGEMLSQGLLTGWAAHGTPWQNAPGFLLLAAVALLTPVTSGKHLYCHHICPHGALQQLLARRLRWQWRIQAPVERVLVRLPFVLLAFIFISLVLGWQVDLNALEPFDAYLFRIAGWASLVIAILGALAALFQPLAYCKYGCPTGALFKLLRFTGDQDRLGMRDWIAAALLLLAVLI